MAIRILETADGQEVLAANWDKLSIHAKRRLARELARELDETLYLFDPFRPAFRREVFRPD